jgi:hypothetical protein
MALTVLKTSSRFDGWLEDVHRLARLSHDPHEVEALTGLDLNCYQNNPLYVREYGWFLRGADAQQVEGVLHAIL